MNTDPLTQASDILDSAAIHFARVDYLNRTYVTRGWTPIDPDEVVFHEIPGQPGILRYEYVNNTPAPVKALDVVGPRPCERLSRWGVWKLLAAAVTADVIEKVRSQR